MCNLVSSVEVLVLYSANAKVLTPKVDVRTSDLREEVSIYFLWSRIFCLWEHL